MHEVKYPLLFAGCGDGICMPFRGERCYIRQCPECSPENLRDKLNIEHYYKDIPSIGGTYDRDLCFCPPVNSSCSNSVRDSYGCVLIKGINEEAKEPCQCLWTLYDKNYPVNLTYTTISYKDVHNMEIKKHYCCPENAQIDFDSKPTLLDPLDIIDTDLQQWNFLKGSHCGNYSIKLLGICVPLDVVYKGLHCHAERYARALGIDWLLTSDVKDQIKNCVENIYPIETVLGNLVYELNITYFKNGIFQKSTGNIRNAQIFLTNCSISDIDYMDDHECKCYKWDITGNVCLGERCTFYLNINGKKVVSGESDCAWFEDWSFYRCKLDVYKVIMEISCKGFNAKQAMEGTGWEDIAPVYGNSSYSWFIPSCPSAIEITKFKVYTLASTPVETYILYFNSSPAHGYYGYGGVI